MVSLEHNIELFYAQTAAFKKYNPSFIKETDKNTNYLEELINKIYFSCSQKYGVIISNRGKDYISIWIYDGKNKYIIEARIALEGIVIRYNAYVITIPHINKTNDYDIIFIDLINKIK